MRSRNVFSFRNCIFVLLFAAALLLSFRPARASVDLELAEHWTQVHDGTAGRTYYAPIYMANGTNVEFSLYNGTLPPGLYLYGYSDNRAAISGTPTAAGTYTFTVLAADSENNTGLFTFTIRIANYNTVYTCYVKDGDPLTAEGLIGTYFYPGDLVQLEWRKKAPAGYCLDRYESDTDLDLNPNNTFYMPCGNVNVTTKFRPVHQGFQELDTSGYALPGADAGICYADAWNTRSTCSRFVASQPCTLWALTSTHSKLPSPRLTKQKLTRCTSMRIWPRLVT